MASSFPVPCNGRVQRMASELLARLPSLAGRDQKEATFVLNMTADWPGLDEEGKSVICNFSKSYTGTYMLLSLPTDGRRPSPPPTLLSEVTQSLYHPEWHQWLQLAEVEVNRDGSKNSLHSSSNSLHSKDNHSNANNEAGAASAATTTNLFNPLYFFCFYTTLCCLTDNLCLST